MDTMDLEDVLGSLAGGVTEEVRDALNSIGHQRDRIMGAVDWVADHGDDVMNVLRELPDMLQTAGEGIGAAGTAATTAGHFLSGAGANGVTDLAGVAAVALERASRQFAGVAKLFTGLPGIGGAASRVSSVAEDLTTVAGQFRSLVGNLDEVGRGLIGVGEQLASSGTALGFAHQTLVGGASFQALMNSSDSGGQAQPPRARAKSANATKTTAKKQATAKKK